MQDLVSRAVLSQAGSDPGHVNATAGTNGVCVTEAEKEDTVEGEEVVLPRSPS